MGLSSVLVFLWLSPEIRIGVDKGVATREDETACAVLKLQLLSMWMFMRDSGTSELHMGLGNHKSTRLSSFYMTRLPNN
jgi:hypothetical protein